MSHKDAAGGGGVELSVQGTHGNIRKRAIRVDDNVIWRVELGVAADAVAEATGAAEAIGAAARERGGLPGDEIDPADVVVVKVL